jgi:pSer/pThr/pTyr-binding forkhead associated (FHA) protein
MKLSLVVISEGKASGQSIPIKLSQFIIGRDPQCHLRPASPVISKRHCALITKNNRVFVRDFDSTNGTLVNEKRIEGSQELKNGDVLKLGPIVFRVQMEGTVAVDKPTPLPANKAGEGHEDDAAALLLVSDGDEPSGDGDRSLESGIPDGTTVMDIPAMGMEAEAAKKDEKADKKKDEKATPEYPNTATAAAAILAKYSRRQRS